MAHTQQGLRLHAVVPGTVLTTLIRKGLLPDPDIGLAHASIPDIYHAGRGFYTYWWCTNVTSSPDWMPHEEDRALLVLHGINHAARWGQQRQDLSPQGAHAWR